MERFDRIQPPPQEENNRWQAETLSDTYGPQPLPAPRTSDSPSAPDARPSDPRSEHPILDRWRANREQRRERLREVFGKLRDSGAMDGLLSRIGQPGEVREKLKMFVDFLSDIKGIRVARQDDGKLQFDIERNKASHFDIKPDQNKPKDSKDPATVKSVDFADKISFKVSRDSAGLKLDDISGIGVNAKVNVLGLGSMDTNVNLRSAHLDKDGDKPVLKVGISHPKTPAIILPVTIPLDGTKR